MGKLKMLNARDMFKQVDIRQHSKNIKPSKTAHTYMVREFSIPEPVCQVEEGEAPGRD